MNTEQPATNTPHALGNTPIIAHISPECALKSKPVRKQFQGILKQNVERVLSREEIPAKVRSYWGYLHITTQNAGHRARVLDLLPKIFGIGTISAADAVSDATMETIIATATQLYGTRLSGKTFAVRSKRSGHKILSTQEISRAVGAALNRNPEAKVNLSNPDVTIRIDIMDGQAYYFWNKTKGAGGLPIGTQGRVITLISGGFDSVVAAWQVMKRGASTDFVFCNMGGSAYERMVLQVTKVLCHIWGSGLNSQFHVIDFQDPIKELRAHVPQKYWQVSLKRQMYKAAEAIATERKAHALVTGEAIGQVSSQTLSNLHTIDRACQMPVLRPLIAFDKTDIIALAYHIGTATLSERIPEHCSITTTSPAVRSTLQDLEDGEAPMDASVLEHAVRTRKILDLNDITANDLRAPYLFVEQLQADHQLIDCQPDAFYKKWHIAGIPHHSPDDLPTLKKQLSKKVPYVLFCNHGVQSALMAESLQQSGFDAYAFRGGLLELNSQYEALIEAQLAAEGL